MLAVLIFFTFVIVVGIVPYAIAVFGIFVVALGACTIVFGIWLSITIKRNASSFRYSVGRIFGKKGVTIYVKSIKNYGEIRTPDRDQIIIRSLGARYHPTPMGEGEEITLDVFVIPDDQQKIIDIVKEIALIYGFDVRIWDLTRRTAQDGINTVPTLLTNSGKRLEGKMTKKKIEQLLSKE
jgi:hypothetical protein